MLVRGWSDRTMFLIRLTGCGARIAAGLRLGRERTTGLSSCVCSFLIRLVIVGRGTMNVSLHNTWLDRGTRMLIVAFAVCVFMDLKHLRMCDRKPFCSSSACPLAFLIAFVHGLAGHSLTC